MDDRGFIPCGSSASPGLLCSVNTCCRDPLRCCEEDEEIRCCNDGTGEVLPAIPTLPDSVIAENLGAEPSDVPLETEAASPESGGAEEDDGSVCFPIKARVEVRGVGLRSMGELKTGDLVRVGEREYSPVFMWTHRDYGYRGGKYVSVVMDGGARLTATTGHIVYVWGCDGCEREAVDIEVVDVGLLMWVVGEGLREVVEVSRGPGEGLFNPQTLDGDIVVDGVVVTCYTKYVPMPLAHAALAPLRAVRSALTFYS